MVEDDPKNIESAQRLLALHAIQRGIRKIGIITAGNHHNDPFVFAFDSLHGFTVGEVKMVCTNNCQDASGAKDWARLLEEVTGK